VKPRHAAALALVGWYLMVPPVDRQRRLLTDKPFTIWDRLETFDSAHACKEWLASLLKNLKGPFQNFEQAVQADRAHVYGNIVGGRRDAAYSWNCF